MLERSRIRVVPILILTTLIITLIGLATHWLVSIGLFLGVIVIPGAYVYYIYSHGMRLAMQGKLRAAVKHYTNLLNLPFVNKIYVYTRRAAFRNAMGDLDGAIADYSAAMTLMPDEDASIYAIRSALYLGKREFEKALADSDRLVELQPNNEIGYANRAAAKMFLGNYDGAIDDCQTGLDRHATASGKALLHNNLGTAHRMAGDYHEAMLNYNLAMGTGLNQREKYMIHPSIMTNQGILYHLKQEYENAKAYFNQAMGINPGFHKSSVGLAVARYKLGQVGEAQRIWMDILKKEPRYRDAQYLERDLNLPSEIMTDVHELIDTMKKI